MKKVRIGCGSGGCPYDRMEPAVELIEKGNLDYIIFECLAERSIASAQLEKLKDPSKGYNPMLEERMYKIMKLAREKGTKIISNMGAANTEAAVAVICNIAEKLNLKGLKVAMVLGDDITDSIEDYYDTPLWDMKEPLKKLKGHIVSANVYLNGDPIKEALDAGADIVITGRVGDPSLFVGPLKHEFGFTSQDKDKMGQAILLGHLLECAGQLTGGFYADPGYKDVENLHLLGFPIAEMDETGSFIVTKVPGSGGIVNESVCREQLLYEINDPSRYITPDGIADFSQVTFTQQGKDTVLAQGATSKGEPNTYKVNIGYQDCYVGEGEISFGGSNSLNRAKLAADIVRKRLSLRNIELDEYREDFIGFNSLYRNQISHYIAPTVEHEVRLRISGRSAEKEAVTALAREVECLYTNGPAGASGITSKVRNLLSVENILIPKEDVTYQVIIKEV